MHNKHTRQKYFIAGIGDFSEVKLLVKMCESRHYCNDILIEKDKILLNKSKAIV